MDEEGLEGRQRRMGREREAKKGGRGWTKRDTGRETGWKDRLRGREREIERESERKRKRERERVREKDTERQECNLHHKMKKPSQCYDTISHSAAIKCN